MTSKGEVGLLTSLDAAPVEITNRDGRSLFLLLGDHAGNLVPELLASLGLDSAELSRHIALDIGVGNLGRSLASELDAPFIAQRYSRLVIDCNRALSHPDSTVKASDDTFIPGNANVTADQRRARAHAIYNPYHEAIAALLEERARNGLQSIVVSLHSFTPLLAGISRPWQVGVLYGGGNNGFATAVLSALLHSDFIVGDNLPYQLDETDFTIPKHAIASGRSYVELEVRQDMLGTHDQIAQMARHLSRVLNKAALKMQIL